MYSFETLVSAFSYQSAEILTSSEQQNPTSSVEKFSLSDGINAARAGKDWHDNTLRAVGHLIGKKLPDETIHTLLDAQLTQPGFTVEQTSAEIQKMIDSARKKWGNDDIYDPGKNGPIPLGYGRDETYALRDQERSMIVRASANQLLSQQHLMGLANSSFWIERFPGSKSLFNTYAAGEALIAACKKCGPFNPAKIRGRGIWLEGDREIINLGAPVPTDVGHHYLCFEPIIIPTNVTFDALRLLSFLEQFNWQNPQDAMLLFGWFAIAPICGVLKRRPHCFVYGPPRCGKTTIHDVASDVLYPLVISVDGQSSEAGIRQMIGPDSLPVIIDEFESDHNPNRLRSVIKLARSAYSAENPLLRGTPEGKVMQFSLRTIFYLSAVNPIGMEPADETRFIMLELNAHDNDAHTARLIAEDEVFFADTGPAWCGHMINLAGTISPSIKTFTQVMPSMDSRHRDNMATLLAGAFVALNGREPSQAEAYSMAEKYAATIKTHGDELDRDEAQECLAHLFSHVVERGTLGQWVSRELDSLRRGDSSNTAPRHVLAAYDIRLKINGEEAGVYIRNGSSNVEKVFASTKWGGGAWRRALRKIPGVFIPKSPVHFPSTGKKDRCLVLPLDMVPELIPIPNDF